MVKIGDHLFLTVFKPVYRNEYKQSGQIGYHVNIPLVDPNEYAFISTSRISSIGFEYLEVQYGGERKCCVSVNENLKVYHPKTETTSVESRSGLHVQIFKGREAWWNDTFRVIGYLYIGDSKEECERYINSII